MPIEEGDSEEEEEEEEEGEEEEEVSDAEDEDEEDATPKTKKVRLPIDHLLSCSARKVLHASRSYGPHMHMHMLMLWQIKKTINDWELINDAKALWTRNPAGALAL